MTTNHNNHDEADNELNILKSFLTEKRLRLTQPRKAILEVFLKNRGHMEIGELYEAVQKVDKSIGMATVYRTMNLLVQCGLAEENSLFENKKCFERAHGRTHHDHLVCTRCKSVKEFHHPMIERFQEETAEKYQFSIVFHRMTLFGVCKDCK